MIYKMWSQECSIRGLSLDHHTPEQFTRCHWQKTERVKPLWIVYRAFVALYFVVSFIYTVFPIGREIPEENSLKYPIFLTHWTYVLEVIQFVMAFFIVVVKAFGENKKSFAPMEKMPFTYKLYWIFYSITLPGAVTVSVIFWGTIYNPELFPATPANLIEHAFNSIFIMIDFFLIAHPVKLLHFFIPATYALLYASFSLIYQLSGGTGVKGIIPIYTILDWRQPESALLTCFLSFLFLLFLHCLFSLLHLLKVYIKKKNSEDLNEP